MGRLDSKYTRPRTQEGIRGMSNTRPHSCLHPGPGGGKQRYSPVQPGNTETGPQEIPDHAFQSDPDQRELQSSPTHGAQTRQVAHHEPLPTHRGRTCPQAFERPQQRCSTKSRRSSPSHNVEQMAHSKTLSAGGFLLSSLLSASPRLH